MVGGRQIPVVSRGLAGTHGTLRALRLFDPSDMETQVFQAALNESQTAFELLRNWEHSEGPDLIKFLAGPGKWMRGQLPLIYANLSNQLAGEPLACRPYLKAATVHEKKRYDVFLGCLKDAIAALNGTGKSYCVVKGVAAANTDYAQPFLRHCHDLDVVVHRENQPAFANALRKAGFLGVSTGERPGSSLRLDHPTGLPVLLHSQPVADDPRFDAGWLLEGASVIDTAAGKMAVPKRERRILHAWLHRFEVDRFERHAWVCDTVLGLRACGGAEIDRLTALVETNSCLTEAHSSARFLQENFDRLPQLVQLQSRGKALEETATVAQRFRFANRARAQGLTQQFMMRLSVRERAHYLLSWLLPPPPFFGQGSPNDRVGLWRNRLRRLFQGGRRRLVQRLVN